MLDSEFLLPFYTLKEIGSFKNGGGRQLEDELSSCFISMTAMTMTTANMYQVMSIINLSLGSVFSYADRLVRFEKNIYFISKIHSNNNKIYFINREGYTKYM